ncbi:MAG: sulfite oxidase-like oxidoreductase [Haloarculaceae archaeon]
MRDVTDLHEEFDGERLPPGQHQTEAFPVLSKSGTPSVAREDWSLDVWGAVEAPQTFSLEEFRALPSETQRQDVHCVTGWSRFDCEFTGVPVPALAAAVGVRDEAVQIMFHAHDGYTTNVPLADCLREEALFAWAFDGDPLPADHGGPVRVVLPHMYAYKGAKWVSGVEFQTERDPGFWEQRGYSVTANPWAEERYG